MQSALRLRFNFRCFDYNTNLNVKHLSNKNSFFFSKKNWFVSFFSTQFIGQYKKNLSMESQEIEVICPQNSLHITMVANKMILE